MLHESTVLPESVPVTALAMVFGDVSVAVGDGEGRITTWAPVRTEEGGENQTLRLIHHLSRHDGPFGRSCLLRETSRSSAWGRTVLPTSTT